MIIYQVGNIIVRGMAEHSTPVSWRGDVNIGEQNSSITFSNFYRLPDTTNITINGTVKCFKGQDPLTQLESLIKLGGIPNIDVIGYLPNICCQPGVPCTVCGGEQGNSVHWWHTVGMIRSINRSYNLDVEHHEQLMELPVTIDMVVAPYWMPLNRYQWFAYYAPDEIDSFNLNLEDATGSDDETEDQVQISKIVSGIELYANPKEIVLFNYYPQFKFYKKSFVNRYLLYDPVYWDDWNDDIYVYGRSLSNLLTTYTVSNTWSGEMKTMHAFYNLPNTGILEIDTQVEIRPFQIETYHAEIDLDDLDTVLSTSEFGAVGLSATDHVLYAATDDISTSFIIDLNTGEPIANLTPYWTYRNRCPGEIFGMKTKVTITKPDSDIEVAALHILRKL